MSESRVPPEAGRKILDFDEAQFVLRARGGDRDAFDVLVSRHLAGVWRIVWRIVRSDADAEDVTQEVFLAAWRSIAKFRGEAAFSTWLHRIATTRAINHVQRASERRGRSTSSLPDDEDDRDGALRAEVEKMAAEGSPSPLAVLEAKELARRIRLCLGKLPGEWRAVLALREADSLEYSDIARVLAIEPGTVRSRLARARMALRTCVEGGVA